MMEQEIQNCGPSRRIVHGRLILISSLPKERSISPKVKPFEDYPSMKIDFTKAPSYLRPRQGYQLSRIFPPSYAFFVEFPGYLQVSKGDKFIIKKRRDPNFINIHACPQVTGVRFELFLGSPHRFSQSVAVRLCFLQVRQDR